MQKYVVRDFNRPSQKVIAAFSNYDVSTIYEAQGKQGLMAPYLRPIQQGVLICGSAVTVTCSAGDNLMIHAAVETCKPGDIIVITTIGESNAGMIGELIVSALMKKGVIGMIIDAGIRDIQQLRNMGFPVWSKAIHSAGTTKNSGGWVNAPAICGGIQVEPGDLIVADDDGVVVIKKEDLEITLDASNKRVEKEERIKAKIASGHISLDFYDLRPVLEKENVKYYDSPEDVK